MYSSIDTRIHLPEMFRSTQVFVRRAIRAESSSRSSSTAHADPEKIRRIPLALMAAAGAAGVTANIHNDSNHRDEKSSSFLGRLATPMSTAMITAAQMPYETTIAQCERTPDKKTRLQHKQTALKIASSLQKMNTSQQVSKLRTIQDEMLLRWERDEEGWRNLPSRAWPEYQPNRQETEAIMAEVERLGCSTKVLSQSESGDTKVNPNPASTRFSAIRRQNSVSFAQCSKLLFDVASGLVFYQVNPSAGFALYESLAKRGHTDAMVACGIVLVEGLGIAPREREGLAWLEKAMGAHVESDNQRTATSMAQASYELGCVYYTGIDGIVDEDVDKAFELFEKAAKEDHTAALYMVADCLVEGEGTKRDVSKAVPLFYKAAERGHRYSRQRIRELLQHGNYPL